MLIGGGIFVAIAAICKFGNFANPIESFIADAKLEKCGEIGAGLFFSVWCFIWLPFQRYKQTTEKSDSEKMVLEDKIQKLKKEIEDNNTKLVISSVLSLEHTTTLHGLLTIKVVNYGQKVARIRHVCVYLNSSMPIAEGVTLQTSVLNIGQKQAIVEIKGDEDMHEWKQELNFKPNFQVHERDGEKYGRGYIELTSEKRIEFEFILLPDDAWQGLGVRGIPRFQ